MSATWDSDCRDIDAWFVETVTIKVVFTTEVFFGSNELIFGKFSEAWLYLHAWPSIEKSLQMPAFNNKGEEFCPVGRMMWP